MCLPSFIMRLLLLIPFFLSLATAGAATFTVANVNNSGAGSLRQAVLDANAAGGADEIVFDTAGTFATARTITLSTPLEVRGALTISAPTNAARQVTLRGAAAGTRLVQATVSGVSLTLRDLILENGKALAQGSRGGAVFADEGIVFTFTAERCTFQDNEVHQAGAALSIVAGLLNLTDCTFRRNTAITSPAFIFTSGIALLSGCSFANNTATSSPPGFGSHDAGSVLTQELGTFTMTDCMVSGTITPNSTLFPAIYIGDYAAGGTVTITDSVFTDNAGGAFTAEGRTVTLAGCRFERNAGAVRAPSNRNTGPLTMTDCVAVDNSSLISWSSDMVIEDCRFDDNAGGISGDGVLRRVKMRRNGGMAMGSITAEDCEFDENTGGGIGSDAVWDVVLRRCALTRNTASLDALDVPGAISSGQSALVLAREIHMESCTVSDNSGYIQATRSMSLFNSTFYGNIQAAPNYDGLLLYAGPDEPYSSEVPITLKNCVFAQNTLGTEDMMRTRHQGAGDVAILSLGGNFIDRSDYISWGGPGVSKHSSDQISTPPGTTRLDAKLGPLLDWGGAGLSRMPLSGSPLIDAGFAAPSAPDYQEPIKDQTGRARVRGVNVDIGAVEARSRFTVTNTNDSGNGSLREAVALANGLQDAEIVFSDATFGTTPQMITLTSGQIVLPASLTITGPAIGVAISGNNSSRIFSIIGTNAVYAMERLHFTRGSATSDGGAVAMDAGTGARLTLRDCVFTQNTTAARGGGLFLNAGTAVITNCQWSTNTAGTTGGGIAISTGATLHLTNSTISGNSALQGGGGLLANNSVANLIHCTVTANTADSDANNDGNGGGIRVNGTATPLELGATVVAGNTDASSGGGAVVNPDISGAFSTLGHNFIGKTDGQTVAGTPVTHGVLGDQAGNIAAPLLAQIEALAENGGLFRTHKPQTGSPLINAGDAALLGHAAWPEPPVYDAREQFREIGTAPDIGAVEAPDAVHLRLVRAADTTASEHPDEGAATYVLQRSRPGAEVTAVLARIPASTAAAADVQLTSSRLTEQSAGVWSVTIGENVLSKTITLNAVDDAEVEPAESFILALVVQPSYGLSTTPAADRTVTVLSNDALVTTTADSGAGSLRTAISSVAGLGSSAVRFDPAFFAVPRTITLLAPIGTYGAEMLIQGPVQDAASLTIDGADITELLDIRGSLTLKDLNIARGRGRIIFEPDVGSAAISINGGSTLTLERCCVRDCRGVLYGGAIMAYYNARVTAINSTFARNQTTGHGGAIFAFGDATLTLTHCTLAENRADTDLSGDGKGGAIYLGRDDEYSFRDASLRMTACISSQNTDQKAHSETNWDTRSRSIETAGANESFVSGGGNFFSTVFDQGGGSTDYLADLQLGLSRWTPNAAGLLPLGNYGGPTLTYALCASSPARGLVTAPGALTDQRSQIRRVPTEAGAYGFASESYDYWKSYTFPAGSPRSGPSDDYDGDGSPNLVEQHAGTDPLSTASTAIPRLNSVGADGSVNLTYPLSARVDPADLILQQSTDLQNWTTASALGLVTYTCNGTQYFVTFTVNGTGGSNAPRRWFRLKVQP